MRGKLLTNLQVRAIRRDYEAGNDVYTVAAWHGVGVATVTRQTKDIRRQRSPKIDMSELSNLLQQGKRKADMARHFGVTWVAVHQAVNRLQQIKEAA